MASAIASSPRYLVLRDLKNALGPPIPRIERGDERDTVKPAEPGCMQLFSFYKPSLEAGGYTVKVSQEIDFTSIPNREGNEDLHKRLLVKDNTATTLFQRFEVIAPQYKIDLKDIHSTYPPQGHADQPNVLPHVVFNDPHLPWERLASDHSRPKDEVEKISTPILPWLAVFPFDCVGPDSELVLTGDQLESIKAVAGLKEVPKQSSKFTISMTLDQYRQLPGTASKLTNIRIPIVDDVQEDLDTPVEVIFMNRALYAQLFVNPGLDSFKYCAHVRNVNTSGMTNAGLEENGLFSIVYSKRTGPTNVVQNTPPRTQVVHLLSLEGVDELTLTEGNSTIKQIGPNDLVAFVALYSWTYLCQPPLTVNFVDTMRDIGKDLDNVEHSPYLGCPKPVLKQLKDAIDVVEKRERDFGDVSAVQIKLNRAKRKMLARLTNGYSLVRHRTASGQETAAISRGALLPIVSETPTTSWPYSSNNGQDLQILDSELGLIDISYSTAWQLGKTMAISDLAFVAALLRVRADAYKTGAVASKTFSATQITGFKAKNTVLRGLRSSMSAVNDISNPNISTPIPDLQDRWKMNSLERSQLLESKTNPTIVSGARKAFVAAVNNRLTVAGSNAGTDGSKPYNEISPPEDVDWAFVQSWLLDRMYLYNIPAHYLVPEPSFLPPESMRFFHIDQTWIESMIDGALSVANHMDKQDDSVRDGIKKCLNKYFETPFSTTDDSGTEKTLHYPQVPVYGFFLRSAVVEMFPDLVVDVPYPETPEETTEREASNPYGKDTSIPDVVNTGDPTVATGKDKNTPAVVDANAPTSVTDKPTQPVQKPKISSVVQNGRTSVLVQKHLGPSVLMVLLDRIPSDGEIAYIQLTQPAHQQRFSAGDFLDHTKIEFQFRNPVFGSGFLHTSGNLYTFYKGPDPSIPKSTDSNTSGAPSKDSRDPPSSSPPWECPYDWKTRCLNMQQIEKLIYGKDAVVEEGFLTSAITGLELNDTMKYLQLMPPDRGNLAIVSKQKPYRLRIPEKKTAQALLMSQPKSGKPATSATNIALPSLSAPQTIEALPSTASSINSGSRSAATPPTRAPSLLSLPDSNNRAVPKIPAARPALGVSPGQSDIECYQCMIYPSTTSYTKLKGNEDDRRSFAWVDTPYDADLIFSLVRHFNPAGRSLRTIEFFIPLGQSSKKRSRVANSDGIDGIGLVKNSPCGTRCRMLSNQRWVVHIDAGPNGEYVILRLIPRSLNRSSPVALNNELTFRLDEVTLDGGDGSYLKEGQVTIRKREVFGTLKNPGQIGQQEDWNMQGSTIKDIILTRKKGYVPPPNMWSAT